jgi:polar amino acid transport system substrate-binding protein
VKKSMFVIGLLVVASMILAGCGGKSQQQSAADLLAEIQQRGTLVVSTDPAYPPQSQLVEGVSRPADTKCASDQRTADELKGFDIEVAKELAKRLGVEICFFTPDWTLITGGNWAGRWDVSVGSMTITPERMEKLYFSQPYYTTPAAFFVHKDNATFQTPSDLSGKKIGACAGCTYDSYLAGTLTIPGEKFDYVVKDPVFTGYDTDINAIQDLALGDGVRLDAVLTALPTGAGAITDGLPLKQLGDPVYFEYLAAAIDKASVKDPVSFVNKVTELIQQMHQDGTLKKLSEEFYGMDLASAAAKFDVNALNQFAK